MSQRLFDRAPTPHGEPATHSTPAFDYLNRSARPIAKRIRNSLQRWFSRYPLEGRARLRTSFRNETKHEGAFFELFCFEFLSRFGLDVHLNDLTNDERSPDFLVDTPGGCILWECTTAHYETPLRGTTNEHQILDALEQIPNHGFWLSVETEGTLTRTLSARTVSRSVERWLRAGPTEEGLLIREGEWWMRVIATDYDADPDERGTIVSPIRGGWLPDRTALRNIILDKLRHYRALQHPIIIAVAGDEFWPEKTEIDAVFGDIVVQFAAGAARAVRRPNGVWRTNANPRPSLLGVVFARVSPWSAHSGSVRYYPNPWSASLSPECFQQMRALTYSDGWFSWNRRSARSGLLVGLRPNWLEEDD